jgi:type IV pilus assembly protein PilF
MRYLTSIVAPFLAALLLLAGCSSSGTSGNAPAAPPLPPAPTATPLKEAPGPVRANLHADLAAGYYERGQLDIALDELGEAVKLDQANPKIYNLYGLVYATLGENANAETNFLKALALAPNDSEVRQNWGWYLCTHNRAKDSIPEFELAVRNPLYRTPEIALINAGKCSGSIGETQRAEEFFRRALSVAPNNPDASFSLATLYYKQGRLADARALIKPVMQQPNPRPEVLYLGMCIERKLGDRGSETSYASQLRNRYPNSDEARAMTAGTCE